MKYNVDKGIELPKDIYGDGFQVYYRKGGTFPNHKASYNKDNRVI